MRISRKYFFLLICLSIALVPKPLQEINAGIGENDPIDYTSIVNEVDNATVMEHVKYLSNLSSRMTGYPECDDASRYIYNAFTSLGLETTYQTFTVTVPVSYGAQVTVLTPKNYVIKAYPIFPNLAAPVATTAEGISGNLIYMADGEISNFDGKDVDGSIVLMNFNSRRNWLTAAKYGAQAVIFIEPSDTIYKEAEDKYLGIPFKFPRLYINATDGQKLISLLSSPTPVTVRVVANSRWEERPTRNVIAFLEGTEYEDKIVQLSSYYDSSSVVLGLAPGAQEAIGTATLMALAEFFVERPPKYTIMFTVFSGHDQAIAGSRKFVEEFGFGVNTTLGSKIKVQINLDISTGTPVLSSFWSGGLTGLGGGITPLLKASNLMIYFGEIAEEVEAQLNKKYFYSKEGSRLTVDQWARLSPLRIFPNDHEATIYAQGGAFTLVTGDVRRYYNTPLDTIDRINIENLKSQLDLIYCMLYTTVNLDNLVPYYVAEWKYSVERAINAWYGWTWITGKAATYNHSVGWYTPIPNATVFIQYAYRATLTGLKVFGTAYGCVLYSGASSWMVDMTDDEGLFNITGINYNFQLNLISVFAYKTNETGDVIYAPDLGIHKFAERILAPAEIRTDIGYIAIMKCGTIMLIDAFDPETLQVPRDFSLSLFTYDFRTHAAPESYGYSIHEHDLGVSTSVIALYVPPETPMEMFARTSYAQRYPLFVLTNSSSEHKEGTGYTIAAGEQLILNTPYESAKSMYWLNEKRLEDIKRYGIQSQAFASHKQTETMLTKAEDALENFQYSVAYNYSTFAWAMEKGVYFASRKIMEGATTTIPLIALFLLIFAFFVEELLLHKRGWKKIVAITAIVVVGFVVLFLNHPGYTFSSDIWMIIFGITIVVLIAPALFVVIQNFLSAVKFLITKLLGKHEISVSRVTGFSQAFSTSIRNINRHKVQSVLVFLTITPVVISLVSLVSISTMPYPRAALYFKEAPYSGILLEQEAYGNAWFGLNEQILGELRTNYGNVAAISPRAWLYTPASPGVMPIHVYGPNGAETTVRGLVGFTPQENLLDRINDTLITTDDLESRWFNSNDELAVILPDFSAQKLGIDNLPAEVSITGIPFTVIGVINSSRFDDIKDIDGGELAPTDITMGPGSRAHFSIVYFLIVQFKDLIRLGGRIITISMRFPPTADINRIREVGRWLYDAYHAYTYVAVEGNVFLYSKGTALATVGIWTQMLPVAICALILMNLMFGIVKSRTQEIEVYSSVGVNPKAISMMFLAQAVTYAVISSILGYLISMVLISNFAPLGLSVNYSSTWVLIAVGIAMGTTIASTLYPMYLASRLVTPSLKRKWAIPTKPVGDEWSVPFPFIVDSDEEAMGILNFMKEFLEHHVGETAEFFNVRDLGYEEKRVEDKLLRSLKMVMGLPPYELGMKQGARVSAVKDLKSGRYNFEVYLHRLSGAYDKWISTNRYILDELRKQLLLWRALSTEEKKAYKATKLKA